MKQPLAPSIQIQLAWATHHAWKPCQRLQSAVPPTLWLLLEGDIELSDGTNLWELRAGRRVFYGRPRRSTGAFRRAAVRSGCRWECTSIFFDNLELGRALDLPVLWRPSPDEWQSLTACARELVRAWHDGEEIRVDADSIAFYSQQMDARRAGRAPIDAMIAHGLARAIFGMCWKRLSQNGETLIAAQRIPDWLTETLQRMDENPLAGVGELARAAGFSPAQFRRSFGEHLGVSPRTYLVNHRLEVARKIVGAERSAHQRYRDEVRVFIVVAFHSSVQTPDRIGAAAISPGIEVGADLSIIG